MRRFVAASCVVLVAALAGCGGGSMGAPLTDAPVPGSSVTAGAPVGGSVDGAAAAAARAEITQAEITQAETARAKTTQAETTQAAPSPQAVSNHQGVAPAAVKIPAIGVDEQLIELGLTAEGTAEVPEDAARAGWFTPGGRPGGNGPTVIMGHVDDERGPAVFYHLKDLAPGDIVEVLTVDGATAQYRVTAVDQYVKAEFPTFTVFGATPRDELKLITCGGIFDRGVAHYTDNIVVSTVRI